jgi:cytochrome c oxidase subunit II
VPRARPGTGRRRPINTIPAALRRTPSLIALLAAAQLAVMALAGTASASTFGPESGASPNADRIASLYWIIFAIALVVWVIVMGTLLYSTFKFKARRGAVAAQIHGNTRLEIGWTIGAAIILVALAVVTFVKLPGIRTPDNSGPDGIKLGNGTLLAGSPQKVLPPDGKSLNICVNGQQYVWRFTYQNDCTRNNFQSVFAYETMVVPTDTTVTLDVTGQDVIHSWWIPKLGGKFDAVPGYVNHTWFKIPGRLAGQTFHGQCAELCGRNHADMVADVKAMTPSNYEAWMTRQKQLIGQADSAAVQQRQKYQPQTNP